MLNFIKHEIYLVNNVKMSTVSENYKARKSVLFNFQHFSCYEQLFMVENSKLSSCKTFFKKLDWLEKKV